jgi:hypothetical protein
MGKQAPKKNFAVTVEGATHVVIARTAGGAARKAFRIIGRARAKAHEPFSEPPTDQNTGGWVGVQIDCKGAA